MSFLKPSDIAHIIVDCKGYDSDTAHGLAKAICAEVNAIVEAAPATRMSWDFFEPQKPRGSEWRGKIVDIQEVPSEDGS
jgi:hypothetical protein